MAKWARGELTKHLAMAPPAVRVMIIHAWHDIEGGVDKYELVPVVGIRSRNMWNYRRLGGAEFYPASDTELAEQGWIAEFEDDCMDFLVVKDGFLSTAESAFDAVNASWFAVCCPWSSIEDCSRLENDINRTVCGARNKWDSFKKHEKSPHNPTDHGPPAA